jgi:hypothetical protein
MWLKKIVAEDEGRHRRNVERLTSLRDALKDIGDKAPLAPIEAHRALTELCERKIVKARPDVEKKLRTLLKGPNRQKTALDAPERFKASLKEVANDVAGMIDDEHRRALESSSDKDYFRHPTKGLPESTEESLTEWR